MKKGYKRPVESITTKVNIDNDDRDVLLEWSRQASAEEGKPVSTRQVLKRLISWFKGVKDNGYPKKTDGNG